MSTPIEKVFVVAVKDNGDNGWGIETICLTRERAEQFISENPLSGRSFYYEIEEHEVTS